MFQLLLFYTLVSSAVFVYGIGLNKIIVFSKKPQDTLVFLSKELIVILLSLCICWPLTRFILVPNGLVELYPFFSFFIIHLISIVITEFSARVLKKNVTGFYFSYCTLLLAINEGLTFANAIIIAVACILAFFCMLPIIYAARWKMKSNLQYISFKDGAMLFLCIAVILFIFFAFNVSWLNPEVF
ncbi:MAG: hypothetical protein K5930_11055 [Treponemataceae bacterium]|nr:hypothetical protein [Treponemataceae bacterium]